MFFVSEYGIIYGMTKSYFWFAGFTAFFAVAVAYVFWGTWSPEIAFVQPDQALFYPADFLLQKWREICGGAAIVPGDIRFLLGGPYVWQELQYALAMYLAALGVAYYLKGRGVGPLARYGAAAAYGLMGYNFTLFSAGHLGWFVFLMYGPFCFGLIDRCVRKGKWVNWVLLGGVLAWGSAQQPDMWLLFTLMAFFYGIFKVVMHVWGGRAVGASMPKRELVRILAGVAVTAAVMFAAGWPQLKNAIFVQTANRDKQIAGTTGETKAHDDKPKSAEQVKAEREKRYVFCTNWSLPPDEIAEFIIPDLKGGSSDPRVSPKNPYRGRIGMQYAQGRWQPYRQHSLYMGFFTVCFALVGIVLGLWSGGGRDLPNRAEVAFWTAASALLLLCALGCFTPFYRLVFAIPIGDYIRCPVKFVHLLEWCVAVLAGFGAAALLELKFMQKAPKVAAAAIAAILVVNALNLAAIDSRYCAVDPGDTVRIAIARTTGSMSIGFVMDGNAKLGTDAYVVAGGTAFRDNAALKDAMAKGTLSVVSFWNFKHGRFVTVPREQAGFALLKNPAPQPRDERPTTPGAATVISIISTLAVCAVGVFKACRRGATRA